MSDGPLVSYILPYWNSCSDSRKAAWLAQAVKSVLNQTYRHVELIAIDDGSTDKSHDVALDAADFDSRFMNVTPDGGHHGIVHALNWGLRMARGEFIARLDADDEAMPDRTECQVEFLKRYPEIGIVGGGVVLEDVMAGTEVVRMPEAVTDAMIRAAAVAGRCPFIHPTVMFRREVYTKCGGYPQGYDYAEDFAYWVRVLRDFAGANISRALIRYRRHRDSAAGKHYDEQQRQSRRIAEEARQAHVHPQP